MLRPENKSKPGRPPKGKEQRSAFGEALESFYFMRNGKSQKDLADITGLGERYISQLITGKFRGETYRRKILQIIQALKSWNILYTLDEANGLLSKANLSPLNPADKAERELIELIQPILPTFPGRLIGREDDSTVAIRELMEGNLLTLVGEGGIGKTRLALHIAQIQAGMYPDGVPYRFGKG